MHIYKSCTSIVEMFPINFVIVYHADTYGNKQPRAQHKRAVHQAHFCRKIVNFPQEV